MYVIVFSSGFVINFLVKNHLIVAPVDILSKVMFNTCYVRAWFWKLASCLVLFSWKISLQRTITYISQPRKATSHMSGHTHLTATSRSSMSRHSTCRKLHCHLASRFHHLSTSVSSYGIFQSLSVYGTFYLILLHALNNFENSKLFQ